MPTYQYQCRDCDHGFEQYQKFSDDALTVCPSCGGHVQRVIQNVGVVFKGSGWYITDSRNPKSASKNDSETATPTDTKEAGDSVAKPAAEVKPAKDSASAADTKKSTTAPTPAASTTSS